MDEQRRQELEDQLRDVKTGLEDRIAQIEPGAVPKIWQSVKQLEESGENAEQELRQITATLNVNFGPEARLEHNRNVIPGDWRPHMAMCAVFNHIYSQIDQKDNRIKTLTKYVNDGGVREEKLVQVIRDIVEMPTKTPGEQEIAWNNAVDVLKAVQSDYVVPEYPDHYYHPEDYDATKSQIPLGGCSAAYPNDDEA